MVASQIQITTYDILLQMMVCGEDAFTSGPAAGTRAATSTSTSARRAGADLS